jgi:hypothetical protein
MTFRTKFRCVKKRKIQTGPDNAIYEFEFSIVLPNSDEDKKFYSESPDGSLTILSTDENRFSMGTKYYIDFTEAPAK